MPGHAGLSPRASRVRVAWGTCSGRRRRCWDSRQAFKDSDAKVVQGGHGLGATAGPDPGGITAGYAQNFWIDALAGLVVRGLRQRDISPLGDPVAAFAERADGDLEPIVVTQPRGELPGA